MPPPAAASSISAATARRGSPRCSGTAHNAAPCQSVVMAAACHIHFAFRSRELFSRHRRVEIFDMSNQARSSIERRVCGPMKGRNMKYLFAAVLVAGTVAGFGAANAAGGCGLGFHRGPFGGCQPNRGGVVVVERPAVVVVPAGRVCPIGFVWRYGRCRPF